MKFVTIILLLIVLAIAFFVMQMKKPPETYMVVPVKQAQSWWCPLRQQWVSTPFWM